MAHVKDHARRKRSSGVRGLLIYCHFKCSRHSANSADQWPDDVSGFEDLKAVSALDTAIVAEHIGFLFRYVWRGASASQAAIEARALMSYPLTHLRQEVT